MIDSPALDVTLEGQLSVLPPGSGSMVSLLTVAVFVSRSAGKFAATVALIVIVTGGSVGARNPEDAGDVTHADGARSGGDDVGHPVGQRVVDHDGCDTDGPAKLTVNVHVAEVPRTIVSGPTLTMLTSAAGRMAVVLDASLSP